MGLEGPSKTIIVEPQETPVTAPEPAREAPAPEHAPEPVAPDREKVPA